MDPLESLMKLTNQAQQVAQRAGLYKGPIWGGTACLAGLVLLVVAKAPEWLLASVVVGMFVWLYLAVASFRYAQRINKPDVLMDETTHVSIETQRMLLGQKENVLPPAETPPPIVVDERLRERLRNVPEYRHPAQKKLDKDHCPPKKELPAVDKSDKEQG